MNKKEVIKALQELSDGWPSRLELYVHADSVMLIERDTQRIIEHFPGIKAGAGDPGTEERSDGYEYLRDCDPIT